MRVGKLDVLKSFPIYLTVRGLNKQGREEQSRSLMRAKWYLVFFLAFTLSACTRDSSQPIKTARGVDARRGRGIYLANCAACHNSDPSKDGSVAPAIKGSSQALLEARVLRASYPPGYTPKRKTSLMPAQPYLKSAIPDLAAYLQ
jgi:mono/diheme cytochrome c family protein